jgi:hypothetical protein
MRGYNAGYDACSDNQSGGNNEGGRSIVGTYAEGYEAGKQEGADDWNSRNPHDSKCPSE